LVREKRTSLSIVLDGEGVSPPPIWMMRQAGRYLPEYRALRERTGSFWKTCMTPNIAAEITLQPIRRFGFDAAILFSDILVIPYALGREIEFEDSVGPSLNPVASVAELDGDEASWQAKLAPVYEAIHAVRAGLASEIALLGFAGAPWTLATYMAEGRGSKDQKAAKLWGYRAPEEFSRLLALLERCVAAHLVAQLEAGATAVQIFDSWAAGLPSAQFADWVIAPTRRIVAQVRKSVPDAQIIGFPRGATLEGYERYAAETAVDAVSIDTAVPIDWAARVLASQAAVQGNLDPLALVAGGAAQEAAVDGILSAMAGKRLIFNLGHGVVPETPVEHVARLVEQVRKAR
jgi:uroporphyrinogen decarboxylase